MNCESVDAVAGEAEERGQQRDRGDHHQQHDNGDRDASGGHEWHAGDCEPEDGDDDSAASEDDRLAGGRGRAADRLVHTHAAGKEFAMAGHEEQRVVDADPEAHHAGQLRRPAGNLDEVCDQ